MRGRWLAAALVCLLGAPAWADDSAFHLQVQAGTNFPLDVSGGLGVETPGRILLSGEVGVLPGAYVDAANGALEAGGLYDSNTGTLLREALKDSVLWRAHLGWRPFPGSGFFFQGGYGVGVVNASLTAAQVSQVTGVTFPDVVPPQAAAAMHTHMQIVDVQLGWRWLIAERMVIVAAIGGVHAISSSSTMAVQDAAGVTSFAQPLANKSAQEIDRDVVTYGNSFELTLAFGLRAF
ncbi:MAG: hypothetical protein JST54_00490 [Deltaproteobacteria bacterium]|nr:hypothetical protein [Deltaproteobacteria bacterium]